MVKLILLFLLMLSLALFAAENTGLVTVHFLIWQTQAMPLALLIVIAIVAGALITLIALLPSHHRRRRELAQHRRELEELRERLH